MIRRLKLWLDRGRQLRKLREENRKMKRSLERIHGHVCSAKRTSRNYVRKQAKAGLA